MADLFEGFGSVIHRCRNIHESAAWYEEKLGLKPFYVNDRDPINTYAGMAVGSTVLALWQLRPDEESVNGSLGCTYITLLSKDLEATRSELEERGVECRPIMERGAFRWFWIFDPDGNRIEFAQVTGEL